MKSSLTDLDINDEKTIEAIPVGAVTHAPTEPGFHRLKTENIKSIEDIALIFAAVKFHFQDGHPFFKQLKERDLL